ncbi:hypothetical protein Gbfr_002_005 [Gluconobacter frateurii M-2]|nr:hypothetical protein Gbfr_002_005 [Gluconobacter frateurii M-2]
MTVKIRTQEDVAKQLIQIYSDAREGRITPKAADRLSRVLHRLKPLLPLNDFVADLAQFGN